MSIKFIDIVHHVHTDLGYTDYPLRARELQARFVGQAVDAVLDSAEKKDPFAWTCEALLSVSEWLQQADLQQTERFYRAVKTGNLDITAIPFNVTPFLSEAQWEKMLNWMPESFWKQVPIQSAMQNDINGFPAAAAERLLDKGVRYLWMGPNPHLATRPFSAPHAFRWRMADGRSLFVWLNGHYNNGFYLFNPFWREGPIPNSNDLHYRWPDGEDVFCTDDASMERAYQQCSKCMAAFEGREPNAGQFERDGFVFNQIEGDYPYETLCVSLTNHWRMDNDPPMAHLQKFVERWNEKGYQPMLRLTTATQAMQHIEAEAGDTLETVEGEWQDWWANGIMACPREVRYSREAKRMLDTATSPVLGTLTQAQEKRTDELLRQLCLFDEHTYSSWMSIASPDSFDVIAAQAEVAILAYRSLDGARSLLADRFREAKTMEEPGIWIANTQNTAFRGWVTIPANCLRGTYTDLRNTKTGALWKLEPVCGSGAYAKPRSAAEVSDEAETTDFADRSPGWNFRFWVPELEANSLLRLEPCSSEGLQKIPETRAADVECDANGWPVRIAYPGLPSMIQPGFAEFRSVTSHAAAPRWDMIRIFDEKDEQIRDMERAALHTETAAYGKTEVVQTEYDTTYTQPFYHPSLKWGKRILTVFKSEPRARLTVRLRRHDQANPEIYYLKMTMSDQRRLPVLSLAGREFIPGQGQIPNTCMDYYTTDGWARYAGEGCCWLVSSQDAPMLTFGQPNSFAKRRALPEEMQTVQFILFDNTWDTNFPANTHGLLEYRFDLMQAAERIPGSETADALAYEPPVLVNLRNQEKA